MGLINPEYLLDDEEEISVDLVKIATDNPVTASETVSNAPKKRGRPPKNKTKTLADGTTIVTVEESPEPLSMWQSNQPYIETYNETTALLRGSIIELEALNKDLREDLAAVRGSKTMRNKYGVTKDMIEVSAGIVGQKINAIKEINATITKAHDLDMKRYKDNKAAIQAEQANSDQRMFDMYNAFVNTPVGTYSQATSFPTMQEMTMVQPTGSGLVGTDIGAAQINDPAYMAYKQRETPEQAMMIMQKNNPNVKTVVVYNQANNTKRFEVRDTSTGEVIQGAPLPADFLLADTTVNINNGVARNANIDTVYPLVLEGMPDSIYNY
jgi:hypothetical protein